MADVPEPSGQQEEPGFGFEQPEGLLAHYTKASTVFEHILPTGRLLLNPYSAMRDPVENKDFRPDGASDDDYAMIRTFRGQARVLSFTHDAGINPGLGTAGCCWARPRMWEQYGDVHRGACLVFDRECLEPLLDERLTWLDTPPHLDEVTYSPQGIADSDAATLRDQGIFDREERTVTVIKWIEAHSEDLYFRKSDDFATEHEYRVVAYTDADVPVVTVDFRPCLVAIVLGEKVPLWQVMGALGECRERGIELRQMTWFNGHRWARRVGRKPADS